MTDLGGIQRTCFGLSTISFRRTLPRSISALAMNRTRTRVSQAGGNSMTWRRNHRLFFLSGISLRRLLNPHFPGDIVGLAVKALRKKLDKSSLKDSKILAPDLSKLKKFGRNFLKRTIKSAGTSISGVSFHQYYLNRSSATWETLIRPETLDLLKEKILEFKKTVKSTQQPGRYKSSCEGCFR